MTCRYLLSASLLSTAALFATTDAVRAQEPVALPGLNVQGATLAKPSAVPPAAAAPTDAPALQSTDPDSVPGIALEKIGTSVSVVTRADIERQQIRNAADALRSLPGVSVNQSGTAGSVTVVRIRGAESRHTLVVVDGVEMNSGTDGFFDFSNLAADDIERIEVLRGPQSGLYGNGALGGVINITTLSGKGPLKLRVQTEGGTLGTGRIGTQLSGGNANAWGSLSATGYRTNGFNISPTGNENDDTRIGSFAAKGGFALSQNFRVEGNFREQDTRAGFDKGFAQVWNGFYAPADAPYIGEARVRNAGLTATLDTFNKAWTHSVFLQGAETARKDTSTNVLESTSQNSKFGYRSTLLIEDSKSSPIRHFLTGLVERRTETFEQPTFATREYTRHRDSVAGEIRGEYFKSLFLGFTARHDQNDDTRDYSTWNVNASYLVPGGLFRLHASAGTGVKYPSFGDLYGFFTGFAPNAGLKPEESRGYDLGVETTLLNGRAVIDATYFNSDLTNEIIIRCPPPTFVCSPLNLTEGSTRRGVELSGRYLLTKQVTVGGAYTYLLAYEQQNGVSIEEVRRPRHQGRVDVNYATADKRGNVNVAAIYNGNMQDTVTDAAFNSVYTTLPSYWNVRLAGGYKLQPGVELFGRVENLLNQHWQEVYGYNATPGATAFAGVKLTFGGKDGFGGTFEK